jgi:sulfur-carrier protein adenylyltransferase/sulfurtransferase
MAERTAPSKLSPAELRRYSRHLLIPQVGLQGQERLAAARVLIVGAGGLGSPVAEYLAAAGVGRIGIADNDAVDVTNLQRQTLFTTADVGRRKATVAAERLTAMNPHVNIDVIPRFVDASNARDIIRLYDVVIDCTDRFGSRFVLNDAAYFEQKTLVHGSIFRFDGQVSVFDARSGPCYRCLYPEAPSPGTVPTCAEGGVLGVLAGIVGTMQAAEALKVLLNIGEALIGRLLLIDVLGARTREVRFERDPDCALCGSRATIVDVREAEEEPELNSSVEEVSADGLDAALNGALLLDVREPHEIVLGTLDNAVHIPASDFEARLHELDSAQRYIVACRVGAKSRWAAARLTDAGFRNVAHLQGGLLAYAAHNHDMLVF